HYRKLTRNIKFESDDNGRIRMPSPVILFVPKSLGRIRSPNRSGILIGFRKRGAYKLPRERCIIWRREDVDAWLKHYGRGRHVANGKQRSVRNKNSLKTLLEVAGGSIQLHRCLKEVAKLTIKCLLCQPRLHGILDLRFHRPVKLG